MRVVDYSAVEKRPRGGAEESERDTRDMLLPRDASGAPNKAAGKDAPFGLPPAGYVPVVLTLHKPASAQMGLSLIAAEEEEDGGLQGYFKVGGRDTSHLLHCVMHRSNNTPLSVKIYGSKMQIITENNGILTTVFRKSNGIAHRENLSFLFHKKPPRKKTTSLEQSTFHFSENSTPLRAACATNESEIC